MPNENLSPPSVFAEIETVIHVLSLYGAAGIAAFGWAMGWLIGVDAAPWLPLWFCAALLIYNADRFRRDPADALNLPARTAAAARWRKASAVTMACAVLVLLVLPVWWGDVITIGLVCGGAVVSLGYSFPFLGIRWKDVPLVKTLFAPAVVTAAVFGPILFLDSPTHPSATSVHRGWEIFDLYFVSVGLIFWAFCFLLFNMLLCDLRDLAGDARCGIRSIPVLWGEKTARRLLWVLAIIGQAILAFLIGIDASMLRTFSILSLLSGIYQACLLVATRQPRSERFHEWTVEGLLYIPAAACGISLFASS